MMGKSKLTVDQLQLIAKHKKTKKKRWGSSLQGTS